MGSGVGRGVMDNEAVCSNVVHSPPPYEQIASYITNRNRGNKRSDQFFDARSSFSHSIR